MRLLGSLYSWFLKNCRWKAPFMKSATSFLLPWWVTARYLLHLFFPLLSAPLPEALRNPFFLIPSSELTDFADYFRCEVLNKLEYKLRLHQSEVSTYNAKCFLLHKVILPTIPLPVDSNCTIFNDSFLCKYTSLDQLWLGGGARWPSAFFSMANYCIILKSSWESLC